MKKRRLFIWFLACVLIAVLPFASFGADRGEKTVKQGDSITLTSKGSFPYVWSAEDDSIVNLELQGSKGSYSYGHECKVTGLRAGTTTVKVNYKELVWEANARADWFGDYGENVTYDRSDTWTVTVTSSGRTTTTPSASSTASRTTSADTSRTSSTESRIKINEVSLSFAAYDDGEDTEYGEVDVTTGSEFYAVEDIEFLSSTSSSKYPRIKVTLYAEDGYYFGSSSKNAFKLEGEGAAYSSANLKNSKETMVLTVELKKYSGAEADMVEDVEWNDNGTGIWSDAANAAYYEVRLKKGTVVIGDILKVEDTFYDFSKMITQTGNYSFQVRTVNRYIESNKSKWVSSERWMVDEDMLQQFKKDAGESSGSSSSTSGEAVNVSTNGAVGWQQDSSGLWYKNTDGTYPAACWQYIDGYWYYFNEGGYMLSSCWKEDSNAWYYLNAHGQMVVNQWVNAADGRYYYVGADGKMLINTYTPDGFYVDSSGVRQ